MVLSGYLIKFPYWIWWQILRQMGRLDGLIFYVDSEHDYFVIENILPHLNVPYKIVARNKSVSDQLKQRGLNVFVWPAFPSILMMTRHAFHRFPIGAIKKIGIKHGTYHFKKMIHPKKYNAFDLYIFVTEEEAKMAAEYGIKCGVVGGQPKLDSFFSAATMQMSKDIVEQPGFDSNKKTILFTTTWDKSGQSAIARWIDSLSELSLRYNTFVSLHPMMSSHYIEKINSIEGIRIVNSENLQANMLVADFLISDTSSVMGEFCALDKPIITFAVEKGKRLTTEVHEMIKDISVQIKSTDELDGAIEEYLQNPELKQDQRQRWQKIFFGEIHVSHGKRVAEIINQYILDQGK